MVSGEASAPVTIAAEALRGLIVAIFNAAGCADDEAARIAHYLVKANLSGHDSHGVVRVARYVRMLREGEVFAGRTIAVLAETVATASIDGRRGFGQTIAPQAVRLGIDKARETGAAVIALRRSGHLGCIGDWAEMAAEAGLTSVHFVNVSGSVLVAPFGSAEKRISTNPVAIGVPRPGDAPLVLDFATSLVAEGKVLVAHDGGPALPEGALIDDAGRPSTDPTLFYAGRDATGVPTPAGGRAALRPMGGHKGSGLALMCELLAGALTGSGAAGTPPAESGIHNGMLSIYIDGGALAGGRDGFTGEIARLVDYVKASRPIAPEGEVLMPGEPERRRRAERAAAGIPLPARTWETLADTARALGAEAAIPDPSA